MNRAEAKATAQEELLNTKSREVDLLKEESTKTEGELRKTRAELDLEARKVRLWQNEAEAYSWESPY